LGGLVVGVVEGAFFEGEAAAADAAAEAGVGFLEEIDLGGDTGLDAGGDGLPVLCGGGLVAGEGCEFGFDFGDGEAEFLGDQGEGEAADVGAGSARGGRSIISGSRWMIWQRPRRGWWRRGWRRSAMVIMSRAGGFIFSIRMGLSTRL
jgi:hypothetical protein